MLYAIWWRCWSDDKTIVGHGPAVFKYHVAMNIAHWLNQTFPKIEHWAATVQPEEEHAEV